LHEVSRLLREPRIEDRKEWERESAVRITALLLGAPRVTMAPAPTALNEIVGPFEQLERGLDSLRLVEMANPDPSVTNLAMTEVKDWASANPAAVATGLGKLKADPEFASWMDTSASVFWQEHAIQHDGLFELAFLPQIALALDTTEAELFELQKLSQNIDELPELAMRRSAGSPGGVIADAYVVAAILRGRYHDLVNYLSDDGQLTHHPIRDAIPLETIPTEADTFLVTNTMRHVGGLLIASAFVEKKEDARIGVYLENLDRLKKWIGTDLLALRALRFGDRVEDEVVRIADQAGIETRGRRTKAILEDGTAAGFTALTSFVLLPWSLVVGVAGGVILKRAQVGERVEGFRREQRLKNLYKAGSGLLRSKSKPPETP
jgi:hypothetical protein